MCRRKHLLRAAAAALALLVPAGAWHLATRLSAGERALVGCWAQVDSPALPDGVVPVIEFLPNRTLRSGLFTPDGRPAPGVQPPVARWRMRGEAVVVDAEMRPLVGIVPKFDAWRGVQRGRVEEARAEVIDGVLFVTDRGGRPLEFRRAGFAPRWADPAPPPPPRRATTSK